MRHTKVMEWEKRLQHAFDRVDERLEKKYGDRFPLHPARPEHGATSAREHDGLFNVGAAFSTGIGSRHGPNYVIEIRIVTLSHIPANIRRQIEGDAVKMLREELPRFFPGRDLRVERDGEVYRIIGDLGLNN